MIELWFRPLSFAKNSLDRIACETEARIRGCTWQTIAAEVLHQARIDHLITIGGNTTRSVLAENRLTPKQIAKLCRRMPPFILAKFHELKRSRGSDIESNPTGAFDTNGWPELRTRLPKFRATLEHLSRQRETSSPAEVLESDELATLQSTTQAIVEECDRLLEKLASFTPEGEGKPRQNRPAPQKEMDWRTAPMRLAQVVGVLKKTNRDMRSEYWKMEWKPTVADVEIVRGDVAECRCSAGSILEMQRQYTEIDREAG